MKITKWPRFFFYIGISCQENECLKSGNIVYLKLKKNTIRTAIYTKKPRYLYKEKLFQTFIDLITTKDSKPFFENV